MAITEKMYQLGAAARHLNDGSDQLNQLLSRIDQALGRMMIGMDYMLPRPVSEIVSMDGEGKRVIELAFVGYLKIRGSFHLAIKTVKVLESRKAAAMEGPGDLMPLLEAPRRLRYAAVDLLPELVAGLSTQVDDLVREMQRRCDMAEQLLRTLENMEASSRSNPHMLQEAADIAVATQQSHPQVSHGPRPRRRPPTRK